MTLEDSLTSAYYYVASRTTWPAQVTTQKTFLFCVDSSHSLLESFASYIPLRQLVKLPIEIMEFNGNNIGEIVRCNLIALSSNPIRNKEVLSNASKKPILTISHENDITIEGGLVYLAHGEKLVPPKVNLESLNTSGLKIDSAILAISLRKWGDNKSNLPQ